MEEALFCDYFKELRIRSGKTLRSFCSEHGFDPGQISKIERGNTAPPSSEDILKKYALALGLSEAQPEWTVFFDLACSQNNRIPFDLRKDENLVGKLPLLFRTLREKPLDENKLRELIEEMRGI